MKNENPVPLRVLVVDDQKMQRMAVRRTLQKFGHTTLEADCGDHALAIVDSQAVDLIISDWMMPGMDGVQLCRTLRARDDLPYIYFILMSGRDTREDLLAGLSAGADDFLRKPLDFDELMVRIHSGQRLLGLQSLLNDRNQLLKDALTRIDADIQAASEFQQQMLPCAPLDSSRSSCGWLYLPSARVSGDALNFFRLDENHVGFYNVDVAGHGVASAMVTMLMTQSLDPRSTGCLLLRTGADGKAVITPPDEALSMLNLQMTGMALGSNYLTCAYGILDERSGRVRLVRAGHTLPVIVHADGRTAIVDNEGDMPVGLFDFALFHNIEFALGPGERLCIYSDGVTESVSPAEVEYGVARLADFLGSTISVPLHGVTELLTAELRSWSGGSGNAFNDDVSMLVVEYANGAGPSPAV
jgi:sigma-B regulation protein RsbU (phosphoserine phosphatase)